MGCTSDNEKELSVEVKSHSQIIELLDEIKSIEKTIHQFDVPETIPFEPEVPLKDVEESIEIIEESATEHQLPITSEIICRESIEEDITPTKWHKLLSKKILSKTSISKMQKFLRDKFFQRKSLLDTTDGIPATFTLRIDDQGNLVGFHIRGSNKTSMITQLLSRIRKIKGSSQSDEASSFTGAIKRLAKKIIPLNSESSDGSHLSRLITKLKGFFPKRSSE